MLLCGGRSYIWISSTPTREYRVEYELAGTESPHSKEFGPSPSEIPYLQGVSGGGKAWYYRFMEIFVYLKLIVFKKKRSEK